MHTFSFGTPGISMFVYIFLSESIVIPTSLIQHVRLFLALPLSILVFSPTGGNLPIIVVNTFTHWLTIINCPTTSVFFSLCHLHASPFSPVLAMFSLCHASLQEGKRNRKERWKEKEGRMGS